MFGGALCDAAVAGAGTSIYIQNQSTVSNFDIQLALPSFQTAVDRDFAPIWHTSATLVFQPGRSVPVGAESILLTDKADCAMCAGYHDETAAGVPYARVFPELAPWQTTFTHELFEMLANPDTNWPRAVHTPNGWYMVEVCDPVEEFSYAINGVPISDFVRPSWYHGSRPFDFTRQLGKARSIGTGGYQIVWRVNHWTEIYG